MLHVATKSVSACAVTVTLPQDVRHSKWYRNYAFYCFCGFGDTDEVRDLGFAPKTGEMDILGNRPVVHSNVKGAVAYGTTVRHHGGSNPGEKDVDVYIPNPSNNNHAAAYYCAIPPIPIQGSIAFTPKYDKHYQHCVIKCSISGNAKSISVDVSVDLGEYTYDNGKTEGTTSGRVSVVVTDDRWGEKTVHAPLGRNSIVSHSKMAVWVTYAFPRSVDPLTTLYTGQLIAGFKPSIGRIQLQHSFLAASRLTSGDSKAILDAFQSMRLASFNGLAFTRDTSRLMRDTSRLVRDLRGAKKDPRKLASVWLSYRYGHRLYYQDCKKIGKAVTQSMKQRPLKFRGRHVESLELFPGTTTRVEYNFTLYVSASCLTDLSFVQAIRSLDFWPSAENLWDLLPYSFIADWFINISDVCRRYDAVGDILMFPIKGALQSVKISTRSVSNPSHGAGYADVTYYARLPLTPITLSTTLLSMNLSFADGISLLHATDAFALAVSRKR